MEILVAQALLGSCSSISPTEKSPDRGPDAKHPLGTAGRSHGQVVCRLGTRTKWRAWSQSPCFHYGDSTIAGDGIARTIRRRLQTRFGDGGPGFLAVHVIVDGPLDLESDAGRKATGMRGPRPHGGQTIPHYGLAGTVSTTSGTASSVMADKIDGNVNPFIDLTRLPKSARRGTIPSTQWR